MPSNKKTGYLAAGALLLASMIWGFAFVVVKNSLEYIPPIYMMAFRFTIAAVGLAILFFKKLKGFNKKTVLYGASLGFFLFVGYALQTIGLQFTTAGKNAFLTTIYVVIVPFLYWIFAKRRPDKYILIATVLALIGIGLLSLESDLSIGKGDAITLLCGFGYAAHIALVAHYTQNKEQDPLVLTILQMFFAAVLSWCVAPFAEGGFPQGAFEPEAILGVLYLGILSTLLAFVFQNVGQKYVSASTAALLLSTESVFGAVFSALVLGETMDGRAILGCVLIFLAIVLAETKFAFLFGRKRGLDG